MVLRSAFKVVIFALLTKVKISNTVKPAVYIYFRGYSVYVGKRPAIKTPRRSRVTFDVRYFVFSLRVARTALYYIFPNVVRNKVTRVRGFYPI